MKMLVHFHVYYHDQVPWFIGKLRHIRNVDWDLLVTWAAPNPVTESLIRDCKPEARFLQVENVGYDVWPFIAALQSIDLDAYDFILKLHTKNSSAVRHRINGLTMYGFRWRDMLVDALLGSAEQFRSVWERMTANPKAGIACNAALLCKPSVGLPEDTAPLFKEMERIGLHTEDLRFCGGTMFLARTAPLHFLRNLDLTASSFSSSSASHSFGSLAHIYERIITFCITGQGYAIVPVKSHPAALWKVRFREVTKPVLSWLFALERRGPERIKYMVIVGIPIRLKG